jgi:hypothetical protein
MTAMSITESVGKFAAVLDELRRKHLGAFELWLNGALGKNPDTAEKEIVERIAGARKQLADDFINGRAPSLLATLKPESKLDIIQQLRTFAAQADRSRHFDPTNLDGGRWQPGLLRPLVGAAVGAATGLLLFLLQAGAPIPASAPATQQPAGQAAPPPASAPAAGQTPPAEAQLQSPPPAQSQRTAPVSPRRSLAQSAFLLISGAVGAAFGAFVVLCPPLRRPTLTGTQSSALTLVQRLGLAYLLLRGGALTAAVSAVVTALVGLIGLLITGPKPLWTVLLGLAALFLIVLFRWAFPKEEKRDRLAATRGAAITALDRELKVDAELWAALAGGLAMRSANGRPPDPAIDHVRSIILARRDQSQSGESILCIVEQELGLPTGPRPVGGPKIPAEFIWEPRHADQYEPFGMVKPGDTVEVKVPPQMTTDAQGITTVFQKGTVVRKR